MLGEPQGAIRAGCDALEVAVGDSESLAAALDAVFMDHMRLKYRMTHVSKFITRLGTPWVDP